MNEQMIWSKRWFCVESEESHELKGFDAFGIIRLSDPESGAPATSDEIKTNK
jgi:hypothetical protein